MKHHYKTVVIEVNFENELKDQLLSLRDSPILESAQQIHMVYIHDVKHPDREDFKQLEEKYQRKLNEFKAQIIPENKLSNCKTKYFFTKNVKIAALDYLKKIQPDLVINATHALHSESRFFCESLSNFLVRNAPCDVFIIRPQQKVS